jgi:hypothetical protein
MTTLPTQRIGDDFAIPIVVARILHGISHHPTGQQLPALSLAFYTQGI